MSRTILVLGAGTGGIVTANELSKKVGRETRILVFEKSENNVFVPSLLWLLVGKRKPNQVFRKTRNITRDGVEVIIGEIEKVDPALISVTVNECTTKDYKAKTVDHNIAPKITKNQLQNI